MYSYVQKLPGVNYVLHVMSTLLTRVQVRDTKEHTVPPVCKIIPYRGCVSNVTIFEKKNRHDVTYDTLFFVMFG